MNSLSEREKKAVIVADYLSNVKMEQELLIKEMVDDVNLEQTSANSAAFSAFLSAGKRAGFFEGRECAKIGKPKLWKRVVTFTPDDLLNIVREEKARSMRKSNKKAAAKSTHSAKQDKPTLSRVEKDLEALQHMLNTVIVDVRAIRESLS